MHLILIKWNVLPFKFMPSMIYSDIEYLFINLGYKNLNLSQGPSNSNQNRRAYSEQTARTVRTAQTSNKYRDYSDAIVDQLISICIFPNSRCRTNLIECTFPCTNQPSEMDLRVGRDETTWKREFRSPYL